MTHRHLLNAEALYEIRVMGRLDPSWSDWFDHLSIIRDGDETLLKGRLPDQAALIGLLSKIHSLGLPLLVVERKEVVE